MRDFQTAIKDYLDKRASEDELFAKSYANEKKSISECCRYIIGEVSKKAEKAGGMSVAALEDAEVFSLAVHYYDEEDIKITDVKSDCHMSDGGASYEPTDEEKSNARKQALKRLEEEAYKELRGKHGKKQKVEDNQLSLF